MAFDINLPRDNQDQQTKEKQRVDYSYENTSLFSIQTPIRFSKEHNERTYVEFMLDKSSKVDKLAKLILVPMLQAWECIPTQAIKKIKISINSQAKNENGF